MQSLATYKKPTVILALRDPLDATLFPNADLIITTFSPTVPAIEAASDYLIHLAQPGSMKHGVFYAFCINGGLQQ